MFSAVLIVVLSGLSGLALGATFRPWGLWACLALLAAAELLMIKGPLTSGLFLGAIGSLAAGYLFGRLITSSH